MTDARHLTERLRSGFGGIVPPICDEAANVIDEALAILAIALPGPRPWTTESEAAKLRIYRNMAEWRDR